MYLLDTTHCLYLMAGFQRVQKKQESSGDSSVSTCTIVRGELMFGAFKSKRVEENIHKVESLLNDITIYSIDEATADIYGELKNAILVQFGPKDRNKLRNFKVESLGFKDNDLWIAAISIQHRLILVSADNHIQRLHGINELIVESW
jgi:tRNA(fMet)-specific endonuclease VapC